LVSRGNYPDITSPPGSRVLKLAEIQEGLPEQALILQYAVLDKRLLTWVISKNDIKSVGQDISQKELSERALSYFRLVSSPERDNIGAARGEAAYFYDLLIKPVEQWLDGGKQLCIVPDKALSHVPFASLLRSASGEYFIKRHAFTISSSSNMFVVCSENARKKEGLKAERLLSVGNPHFDRKAFKTLDYLDSARREAERVADCYGARRPLVERQATEGRVRREAEQADVAHFALHAVSDERSPMLSKLLFAPEAAEAAPASDNDGLLHAYEVYELNLSRLRVVILSACRSGVETYYRGEGMVGISRPFIARGVPLVVASLWPADSRPTAELMINFHKLRKGESPSTAEALRQAQLAMLGSPDETFRHPYYWAAFAVVGGYASF
jgi:CHAT domain-containing protein